MVNQTQHDRMVTHLKSATAALERHLLATAESVASHLEQTNAATTPPTSEGNPQHGDQ